MHETWISAGWNEGSALHLTCLYLLQCKLKHSASGGTLADLLTLEWSDLYRTPHVGCSRGRSATYQQLDMRELAASAAEQLP